MKKYIKPSYVLKGSATIKSNIGISSFHIDDDDMDSSQDVENSNKQNYNFWN